MDSQNASPEPTPSAKPEEKAGFWGKVFSLTPVVLTIIATTLAGISSSELTQSMYWRSLAAQNQSKAGDQWSFFQVKRVRGTTLESTVELMQSLGSVEVLTLEDLGALNQKLNRLVGGLDEKKLDELGLAKNVQAFRKASQQLTELLADPAAHRHLGTLFGGPFPSLATRHLATDDPQKKGEVDSASEFIEQVRQQIAQRKTERETAALVAKIKAEYLETATQLAEGDADEFDKLCKPLSDTANRLRQITNDMVKGLKGLVANWSEFGDAGRAPIKPLFDQFNLGMRMAVTDFNARRYRQESSLNQRVAELYEVRVRRSGVESDRHRTKSTYFFYAMIAAQAGVTIASLAMARTRKSLLWLLATIAGLSSIGFAAWIYLTM
jgi:hypothetical protein